jgi:hypothetical protein
MIGSIHLKNLKCFDSLLIDLAPFTIFCGFNSAGKSTALQALLLLSQTLQGHRTSSLRLNGPLTALGSPAEVLGRSGASVPLTLGLSVGDDSELLWEFNASEDRRFLEVNTLKFRHGATVEIMAADDLDGLRPKDKGDVVDAVLGRLEKLVYLSAARDIENDVFPIPQGNDLEIGNVGSIGQFASWWFHHQEDAAVPAQRCCGLVETSSTLRQQVNSWASHLFAQAELNSVPIPKTGLIRLELKTGLTSDWSRPANNGYGVSYAFPILVGGLVSPADQTIIIDSPEAHLHPRGQSRMGSFLAQMAASGVQILVETHSDHFLNGVRIALRERLIKPEDVAIYFFTGREEAQVVRLSVSQDGNVSDWPEGFFDQSEKDLANLAGWS